MEQRELDAACVVLVMANFTGENPGTLKIIDDFIANEARNERGDLIAMFAGDICDRMDLLQIMSFACIEELQGTESGHQLRLIICALGELGIQLLSPNPGPYGDLLLATQKFYELDRQ